MLTTFQKPGVLSVRSSWRSGPRGLTGQRAIIVTVAPEQHATLQASLPVPVELRVAQPLEQMCATHAAQYLAVAAARHELRQPDFPDEVFFDTNGQPALPPAHPQKKQLSHTIRPHSSPPQAKICTATFAWMSQNSGGNASSNRDPRNGQG